MAEREREALESIDSTSRKDTVAVSTINDSSNHDSRYIVLVVENTIVCGPGCPKEAAMRLQVVVEIGRVGNIRVYDCASSAVTASVGLVRTLREESDVVSLANDNDGYTRVHPDFLTGRCTILVSDWREHNECK
jgi:hypothetical protein